jgi:uncharacterized protein (DUF736 family)
LVGCPCPHSYLSVSPTLRTLTLNVKVRLVSNHKGDKESAPDFRLQAAGHDIGAAWKKVGEAGNTCP